MRFHVLTLFPEFFDSPLAAGLMGRARERGLVDVELVNPRDFTADRHRTVDDRPYGGGPGMVMMIDPLLKALESVPNPGRMLLLTPGGRPLDQSLARELAREDDLTLVCGRYEGIDARLETLFPLEPVSIGDYVLNGGETGALAVMESVSRLLPEFMGHECSGEEESFSSGLLEYPHYTRPEEYEDLRVPDVLTSGDHARIRRWRREQSLAATLDRRPELLASARLEHADVKFLRSLPRLRPGRNLFLCLVHHPVLDREKKRCAVSLTNLDVHDISRVSRSYGLGGFYVLTPLEDQKELARTLLRHWTEGAGARTNPDRAEAMRRVRVKDSLDEALADIRERTGARPVVAATSARMSGSTPLAEVRRRLAAEPVALVLGTGHGLAPEILRSADAVLPPLRFLDGYNHLSVRSAAAVYVDRLLSDHL